MLKRLVLLTAFAAACGSAEMNPLEPGRPQAGPAGPLTAGTVDSLERFDRAPFMDEGSGAVVAVTPDKTVHTAAIDAATQWPRIGPDATPFPGERGRSTAVALLADSQGRLHAVWDRDEDIVYARLSADTYDGEVRVLGQGRQPNLALGEAGRVVVSFISTPSREAGFTALLMVVEGQEGVFEAPVATQAEPEWALVDGSVTLSGASMAIDAQGDVHLVYEWMLYSSTVVEYIRTVDGVWSDPVKVADAAFSPCPDIALDSAGRAHIVYLLEGNDAVMYVTIDNNEMSRPASLFDWSGEFVRMAKIAIDARDELHLIIDSAFARDTVQLRYLGRPQQRGQYTLDIGHDNIGAALRLTPRAGGALITTDGEVLVPFVRSSSARIPSGTLELATGIKVTRS